MDRSDKITWIFVASAIASILMLLFGENLVGRFASSPPAAAVRSDEAGNASAALPSAPPAAGNGATATEEPAAPDSRQTVENPPAATPGPPPAQDVAPEQPPPADRAAPSQPSIVAQAPPASGKPSPAPARGARPFYRGADGQLHLTDEQIDMECRQITDYMSCVQAGGYAKWEEQQRRSAAQAQARQNPKPFYRGADGQLHLTDEQIDRECKQIYYYAECVQAGGYANWEAQQRRR